MNISSKLTKIRLESNYLVSLLLSVFFIVLCSSSYAQNVKVEIGTNYNFGKLKYKWTEPLVSSELKYEPIGLNYYISAQAHLGNSFYIKTQLGTSSYSVDVDVDWELPLLLVPVPQPRYGYTGNLKKNQMYFALLLEKKFEMTKDLELFVGIGPHITKMLFKPTGLTSIVFGGTGFLGSLGIVYHVKPSIDLRLFANYCVL